jgi:hypothetical protein
MKLVVAVVMLAPVVAHADEPGCPLDMFEAASGTWSTMIAETIDECLADPVCAAQAGMAPRPRSAPPPSGRFADAAGTIGVRSDSRTIDEQTRTTDAWVVGRGAVHAGWRRGLQVCAGGTGALGSDAQVESRFGAAFPWSFVSVAIGGGQRWHARPALSSPRIWLRRSFIENEFHAQMSFGTWRHASGGVSAIVPARIATSSRQQIDGPPDPGVSQRVALSMYEYAGANARLEVLRFGFDTYHPDGLPPEGTTMPPVPEPMRRPPIDVVRIDPFAYAGRFRDLYVEFDAGYLDVDDLGCWACAKVAGTIAVGDEHWHARYDRDAYLAYDARVTVEDRVSARYRHALGKRHAMRIDGFAAITRTDVEPDPVLTGGGIVGVDLALPQSLDLAIDAEVGRSFYARLDGDPVPVAEPAARLGVTLSRSFGH